MENETVVEQDDKQLEPVVENDEKVEEQVDDTTKKTEELNPYKKEMAQLAIENRQKAGALKESREREKELEERLAALEQAKEEVVEEEEKPKKKRKAEDVQEIVQEAMRKQRFEDKLVQISSNKDEQELIRHHYNNSIVRTGNVEQDLSNAVALANKHLIDQAKKADLERQETEALNARFSSGRAYSKQGGASYLADPVKKGAVEILKKLGITDGEKYV